MKQYYGTFYHFFKESLVDPNKDIQVLAMKCIISVFDCINYMSKEQISQYKDLVLPILQILDKCVADGDDETVQFCFDAFGYLAESKVSIFNDHFKSIVEYACSPKLLLNPKVSKLQKECILDLFHTIGEYHKSVFNKNEQLMQLTLNTICEIIALPLTQEQLEEDEEPIQDVALWLIQSLTNFLNKKKTYSKLLEIIQILVNSNNSVQMNAGFLIMAQMCEGCSYYLSRNLQNPIMNTLIPKGLAHPAPEVKGAAMKAIGYLSEYVQEEMVKYHAVILPAVLNAFNDTSMKVVEKAVQTTDIYFDNMDEDDLLLYLPEFIPRLAQIPYIKEANMMIKRPAVAAIASSISTTGSKFIPFVPSVTKVLHELIFSPVLPETTALIAEAINAMGKIAIAVYKVDKNLYQQVVLPCTEQIYQIMVGNKDYELREGCFSFFYSLASVLEKDFEPFFDRLINFAFDIAVSQEGINYIQDKGDFSLDTDSEDEDEELEGEDLGENATSVKVKTTFIDEKAAAIHAIGEFALACPTKFASHFKRAYEILEQTYDFFQDNIRKQSIICYKDLMLAQIMAMNNGQLPKYKPGLPCVERYPPDVEELFNIELYQKFDYGIKQERNAENVATAVECLQYLIKKLGPPFIHHNLDDLVDSIIGLLEKKYECFNIDIEDENDEDDEMQMIVFEELVDLIPALAKALGASFEMSFIKMFPSIMAYTQEEQDVNEKIQAVGCLAQCYKRAPSLVAVTESDAVPALLELTQVGDDELNRNLAYCFSLVFAAYSEQLAARLNAVLLFLKATFEKSKLQATKDNAAAAICRIAMAYPNFIPIEHGFAQILDICPLAGDEQEERTIIQLILYLADKKPDLVVSYMNKCIQLLLDALLQLKKYRIKDEMKSKTILLIKNLASQE